MLNSYGMTEAVKDQTKEDLVKKMFDLGAHFGYGRNSRHPSNKSFLFGLKCKTVIFDLEKSADSLNTRDVLTKKYMILLKEAVQVIEKTYKL